MEIKIEDIKELFIKIGRDDINEEMDKLATGGAINSLEIMSLVQEIESVYGKEFDFDLIELKNFDNFIQIKNTIMVNLQ
ncbi:acyl carrier protein [Campylobacter lari]|nr:acyl carrier protein [Campylobacter lari]